MVRFRRTAAIALAGLGLALAVAACSDNGVDRDDIVAKIRSDPRMADSPDRAVQCLADWYMESATVEQREAYVAGRASTNPDDIAAVDGAVLNCLKLAAGSS